jgi:hypothetical protein
MDTYDSATEKTRRSRLVVHVADKEGEHLVIADASISVFHCPPEYRKVEETKRAAKWTPAASDYVTTQRTNQFGIAEFDLEPGQYLLFYRHVPATVSQCIDVEAGCVADFKLEVPLNAAVEEKFLDSDCNEVPCGEPRQGDLYQVRILITNTAISRYITLKPPPNARVDQKDPLTFRVPLTSTGPQEIRTRLLLAPAGDLPGAPAVSDPAVLTRSARVNPVERPAQMIGGNLGVSLQRTATAFTDDITFWQGIINNTEALLFNNYLKFMDMIFCGDRDLSGLRLFEQTRFGDKEARYKDLLTRRALPFVDSDAYRVAKVATEAFVMVNCAIMADPLPFTERRDKNFFASRDLPFPTNGLDAIFRDNFLVSFAGGGSGARTLPYLAVIRKKLSDIDIKLEPFEVTPDQLSECYGILQDKLTHPCLLELIWSYWHEEGMLVQTANAIARRFQNVRGPMAQDPLANLEIDPLRPINNLMWGYVQDEQHRLTVVRRNYEYYHHYGIRLDGRAVQGAMNPADTRSKFLEAFHNLLRVTNTFYKQDDDTTIKADAFPVLNALKEVHLILTEGQHNQFGDLPSTARVEMLFQEWLLARPEFREFLPTRISVAYPEPWMDRVDAMKKLQGWTDTSVMHFRNLGVFGEQILLGIRWGFWSDVQEPVQAFNWARAFRPQIQGYIHAYRAVTGVDLTAELVDTQVEATMPSMLLRQRLSAQQRGA